jgi:hypothetical protein
MYSETTKCQRPITMAAHLDQSNYQANQKHMLGLAVPEHPMPKKKYWTGAMLLS